MLPVLLALALAPPPAPSPGPTPGAVKGLMTPIPLGADVGDYVRWSLREMGQAVVVVEAEYAPLLPKLATGIRIMDINVGIFRPKLRPATEIPAAPWMDTSRVMAGGNVAQKMYPIGWGY